jgi:hypothetical protein
VLCDAGRVSPQKGVVNVLIADPLAHKAEASIRLRNPVTMLSSLTGTADDFDRTVGVQRNSFRNASK